MANISAKCILAMPLHIINVLPCKQTAVNAFNALKKVITSHVTNGHTISC